MDRWLQALTAFGGFAAIGVLIDLAMYRSEKDQLKLRLDDWWLRFTDIKWSNFGRAEAELAIEILDHWAGRKLWSKKRWLFSFVVVCSIWALTTSWILIRWWAFRTSAQLAQYETIWDYIWTGLLLLPSAVVGFALSMGITRFMAALVARVANGPLVNSLKFTLLLVIHLVLLLYLSTVILLVMLLPAWAATAVLMGFDFQGYVPGEIKELLSYTLPERPRIGWLPLPDWSHLFSVKPFDSADYAVINTFKIGTDFAANGVRIMFALAFLSSVVFRPLIQEPVARLWYGAMNKDKPIFTTLFSGLGAVVAALQIFTTDAMTGI